ncbi:hypothetical protein BDF22DRAFT_740650 [Syncephalis plumigaleata]|nr:hypothetical protein BDF22DRAFT_740650 [Syncephalis plumigaleata]
MNHNDIEAWKQKLVGKRLLRDNEAAAEGIDESMTVHESKLPNPHRILGPSSVYTMDFIENRLNVRTHRPNDKLLKLNSRSTVTPAVNTMLSFFGLLLLPAASLLSYTSGVSAHGHMSYPVPRGIELLETDKSLFGGPNTKGLCRGIREAGKINDVGHSLTLQFEISKPHFGMCEVYILDENLGNARKIASKKDCAAPGKVGPWTVDIPSDISGRKVLRWVWNTALILTTTEQYEQCADSNISGGGSNSNSKSSNTSSSDEGKVNDSDESQKDSDKKSSKKNNANGEDNDTSENEEEDKSKKQDRNKKNDEDKKKKKENEDKKKKEEEEDGNNNVDEE